MSSKCYHCHLPVPSNSNWKEEFDGEVREFCCPACLSVCSTIYSLGQTAFYEQRDTTKLSSIPEQYSSNDFLHYDDNALLSQFTTIENGFATSEILIENIHCSACCWLIENTLHKQRGVRQCNVNLHYQKLSICWDVNETKISHLFSTLQSIGYIAQPYSSNELNYSLKQQKNALLKRIGVSALAMMQVGMCSIAFYMGTEENFHQDTFQILRWYSLILTTIVVFYSGYPFIANSISSLRRRQANMDIPVTIAILSAYAASAMVVQEVNSDTYFESICMFIFFLLCARFVEVNSRISTQIWKQDDHKDQFYTSKIISESKPIFKDIPLSGIQVNTELLIKAGTSIPVDGTVVEGQASINESSLNGEFIPVTKSPGASVYAGSVLEEGYLLIRASTTPENSQLSLIKKLVEKASHSKSKFTQLADALSGYFVYAVLFLTLLTALVGHIFQLEDVFSRVLAVLVVSCPCALALATPTAITIANIALQKIGIFILNANAMEKLAAINEVIFDKTGTLTQGKLRISNVQNLNVQNPNVQNLNIQNPDDTKCRSSTYLDIAKALEKHSDHPVARAFSDLSDTDDIIAADDVNVIPCRGIEGSINGQRYRIGSLDFCSEWVSRAILEESNKVSLNNNPVTSVWLITDERPLCRIDLSDSIRSFSQTLVEDFNRKGITTHILSGDQEENTRYVAEKIGIKKYKAKQTPQDKLEYLHNLTAKNKRILAVGDGLNDTPLLAAADVSIAMNTATDFAKLKADIINSSSSLFPVYISMIQAKKMNNIIKQNLVWALIYNFTAIPFAAMGLLPPYLAAIGMSISSIVVVLNASRLRSLPGLNSSDSKALTDEAIREWKAYSY